MLTKFSSPSDSKLGYTSTVKDQVQNIEINIDTFKRILEQQRKQQGEVQFSIKQLEQKTKTSFHDLNKDISDRINYLTEIFKSDTEHQSKQFQYLEIQNSKLHEEHEHLNQFASVVCGRTGNCENNVGL